jgi:hypothetical protein
MNIKDGTPNMLHRILFPANDPAGLTVTNPGNQRSRSWRNRFRNLILAALWVGAVTGGADCLRANLIPLGPITVDALSTTGVSFSYTGTLTQNDTLELTVTGDPCLQPGPAYCVNGAGVVTVAGTAAVVESVA